jgi:hypothetical protein
MNSVKDLRGKAKGTEVNVESIWKLAVDVGRKWREEEKEKMFMGMIQSEEQKRR